MEQRTVNGVIYESVPGGGWKVVGYAQQAQPTTIQTRPADPTLPYDVAKAQADAARATAEAPYAADIAQSQADKARVDTATARARGGVDTTEAERTAAFLATRVAGGIAKLGQIGMGRAPSLFESTAGETRLGNYTNNEDWQRTLAAQRDITDALLTLGTGAAYTAEQIEAYRQSYFPQPGDKAATIADKRERLSLALEAAKLKAGAASSQIDDALKASNLLPDAGSSPPPIGEQRQGLTVANLSDFASGLSGGAYTVDRDGTVRYNGDPIEVAPEVRLSPQFIESYRRQYGEAPPLEVGVRGGESPQNSGTYQDSQLGQGMSGVNEGIAGTLGLPVDLATAAINVVPSGLNAIANTNLPKVENPFMGGDWWKNLMSDWAIYDPAPDGTGQFARRVGQSIGAAAIPVAGTANSASRIAAGLLAAGGGGVGGAGAQRLFPGSPVAEFAGEVLGSGLTGTGLLSASRRREQQAIEDAIPTIPQLKDRAGELYREAEAAGQTASPQLTQQLADDMRSTLGAEGRVSPTGRISEVYPKAREAMQLIDDYAGQPMTPTQLQTVRSVVADGMTSADRSERRIASQLLDTFDNWAAQSVPGLDQARSTASRYLNAEKLERARELAGARAGQFSGSGYENALRTEYRGLDRNTIKGRERFNDDLAGAIETVSRGNPSSNFARALGKMAPTGVVSGGLAVGVPFSVGNAVGGPLAGAAASLGTTGLGIAGRAAATRMGIRNADIAELIARNGGPIEQAQLLGDDNTRRVIAAILAGQAGEYLPSNVGQ